MNEISDKTRPEDGATEAESDWRDRGGWRHPYLLYILGTGLLFVFLVFMGYLALESGWIPSRGISQP